MAKTKCKICKQIYEAGKDHTCLEDLPTRDKRAEVEAEKAGTEHSQALNSDNREDIKH